MILTKYLTFKLNNNITKFYKNLGYIVKGGDIITVPIEHLQKSSNIKILVKCDYCENEKYLTYYQYNMNTKNNSIKYACCRKCANEKYIMTMNKNYNVDNISQLNIIKEKKKTTCFENNNVLFPQQSDIIYSKSKQTKKEKYDNEYYNNNEQAKKTNLIKYNETTPLLNNEIKNINIIKSNNTYKNKILLKYENNNIIDYNIKDKYIFKCDQGCDHNFKIKYKLLYHRKLNDNILCTICNPINKNISGLEIQFLNFIKENYNGTIIINTRKIINPYELDIYLPELNIAFEFNGLFYHSNYFKNDKYHLNKTKLCNNKNINLIMVWEDEWIYKKDIIKSNILRYLNINIKLINKYISIDNINDEKIITDFLKENNIYYLNIIYDINISLLYNNEIIAIMFFKKYNDNYKIVNYTIKNFFHIDISYILDFFILNYNFNNIILIIDKCNNNFYLFEKYNFIKDYEFLPESYFIINNKKEKYSLLNKQYLKIYNSGYIKYILKNDR